MGLTSVNACGTLSMPSHHSASEIHYQTIVKNVAEVSLLGGADLEPWRGLLAREALFPLISDGKAQIRIIAAEMRFLGVKFRELSISVGVSQTEDGQSPDGVFLIQAFNSFRFFAFVERMFFHAPYLLADVQVRSTEKVYASVVQQRSAVLRAERHERAAHSAAGEDTWQGVVYLPKELNGNRRLGKRFFAKLSGPTEVYPFSPETDVLNLRSGQPGDVFELLNDSNFAAKTWHIRNHAMHCRSKSYDREE